MCGLFLTMCLAAVGVASPTTHKTSNSGYETCVKGINEVGAVFALTNRATGNEVVAFSRATSGELTHSGLYGTGGHGIGVDFDTQGGLWLSSDNRFLYALSPGSDQVTVFSVNGSCLQKIQEVYAGDQPLSITLHTESKLAYVLDGSVASTGIFGFKVAIDGTLSPLTNETIPTSTPIGVPGDVVFSPDGKALVVTNKVGSSLDIFSLDSLGNAELISTTASVGMRPFAATFRDDGMLFVVESGLPITANAGVSSYNVNTLTGSLTPITVSEKNEQTDGCWIVLAGRDQRYGYVANFASGTVSSFDIAKDGSASLLDAAAGFSGNNSQPVDLAKSEDGKFLYNLLRGTGAIAAWNIRNDGSLESIGHFGQSTELPRADGASGLAAF